MNCTPRPVLDNAFEAMGSQRSRGGTEPVRVATHLASYEKVTRGAFPVVPHRCLVLEEAWTAANPACSMEPPGLHEVDCEPRATTSGTLDEF